MKIYIGLDAHSTTSTFVAINDRGKEILCTQVPTNADILRSTLNSIKGEKHLVFEESNLSQWLYVSLKTEVHRTVVCATQYLNKQRGAKTDVRDSRHLAKELRNDNLVPVYKSETDELIRLRGLASSYQDIVRDLVRNKNRFKALFRSQAITEYKSNFYSDPKVIELLDNEWDQYTADYLMYQIQTLENCKKNYIDTFRENKKRYKPVGLLTSIPGIDVVRANLIAAITCDAKRFKNKHHYWSYCMLVKHKQISASKVYGLKYSHGRSELKDIFMGCALSQIGGNNSFNTHYVKLIESGVCSMKARKTIARKTAAIALAVMRSGRKYNDNWKKEYERLNPKK